MMGNQGKDAEMGHCIAEGMKKVLSNPAWSGKPEELAGEKQKIVQACFEKFGHQGQMMPQMQMQQEQFQGQGQGQFEGLQPTFPTHNFFQGIGPSPGTNGIFTPMMKPQPQEGPDGFMHPPEYQQFQEPPEGMPPQEMYLQPQPAPVQELAPPKPSSRAPRRKGFFASVWEFLTQ